MTRNIFQQHPDNIAIPLPITLGGTGHKTASQALVALSGVPASQIGTPNGLVPLDVNAKVPKALFPNIHDAAISIVGPAQVFCSVPVEYQITDYNYDLVYNVSGATISLNQDTITLTPPDTPGVCNLRINETTYAIPVIQSYMQQPTIISLSPDAIISTPNLNIIISDVAWAGQGGNVTPQIQIATDSEFTVNVQTFSGNTNSNNVDLTGLSNGNYFARSRYTSNNPIYQNSDWSNTTAFAINASLYPTTEIAILHRPDIVEEPIQGGRFGNYVTLSPDGTVLAAIDPTGRKIYIYKKINNDWVYQNQIPPPFNGPFHNYLRQVSILEDNQTFLVANFNYIENVATDTNTGAVHVFRTSVANDYSTLTEVQTIRQTTPDNFLQLASGFSVTKNGQRLVVHLRGGGANYSLNIYDLDNGSYSFVTNIPNPDTLNNSTQFGYSYEELCDFTLSVDGLRLVVGDYYGGTNFVGQIYVYDYDGVNWNLTSTLIPDQNIVPEYFGGNVLLSPDKNTIVASFTFNRFPFQYGLYIFKLINNVWTKIQKVENADWNDNTLGGSSSGLLSFSFSNDGQYLLVGSPTQTAISEDLLEWGYGNADGAAYLYKQAANGTWEFTHKYTASDHYRNQYFGYGLAMNGDCTEIIVGSPHVFWSSSGNENGSVYVFR